MLACAFEKIIELSTGEFDINLFDCVILSRQTWRCGLNYTDIKLQTIQGRDMIHLLEKNFCDGISSVIGDRCVIYDDKKR